jgi:hypothetical protein
VATERLGLFFFWRFELMAKQLSGPRAALAAAIESHRDGVSNVAARDRHEAAMASVADEREGLARQFASGGDVLDLVRTVDRNASSVDEMARVIETCKSARSLIQNEISSAERSAEYKATSVRSAIGEVLAAEALDGLLADANRLKVELARVQAILRFLRGTVPGQHDGKIERALRPAELLPLNGPEFSPWRAAVDSLTRDATGELP